MNRLVVFLVTVVVLLVGALMFTLGRGSGDNKIEAKIEQPPVTEPLPGQSSKPKTVASLKPVPRSNDLTKPVKFGGSDVTDACAANSKVVGLNPNGDNFLAVKSGPSLKSKRIDKLGPDAEVYPCDTSADGQWVGIVYDGDGKWTARCGVTSPVARRQSYNGPCLSGWVSAKYLELIAG